MLQTDTSRPSGTKGEITFFLYPLEMLRKEMAREVEARRKPMIIFHYSAPVAQLDRASGYEPEGREFESPRAHHFSFFLSARKLQGLLTHSTKPALTAFFKRLNVYVARRWIQFPKFIHAQVRGQQQLHHWPLQLAEIDL
jgi:hypothetical protein